MAGLCEGGNEPPGSLKAKYAIRKVQDNREGLDLNGLHQLLVYADDVNMLGENPQKVRENTGILLEASKAIGLEVNPEKTNYPPYLEAVSSIRNLRTRHAVVIGTHNTWTSPHLWSSGQRLAAKPGGPGSNPGRGKLSG
ncbi:hypothetical protein ANN_26378 [Periplaneta americana]|uniref:Reverse transcriptase domain-containing protein n=1 Tax=Periplaneta americana TaxID=6978 RepID=A0ABQ8RY27_PERAM|nr:hypothetical protein ANN_26378 [Periplaneta americana]